MKSLALVAALYIPLGMLSAEEAPPLKDGLWSISTQYVEHPTGNRGQMLISVCRNNAYDKQSATKPAPCKVLRSGKVNGVWTKDSECSGTNVFTTITKTSSDERSSHVETHVFFRPPSLGREENVAITEEKYVGPCPAGVNPGDWLDANGKVAHHGKQ
jgi:hypothetical protein